mmetsp:Transcript_8774/g.26630  ORF Transcript_8774/g.26630 Transcript_8774/m.26630 type:complete len:246 (-) Transcript_8774:119-856(-)
MWNSPSGGMSFARLAIVSPICLWSSSSFCSRRPASRLTSSKQATVRWACRLCASSASVTWSVRERTAASWSLAILACAVASSSHRPSYPVGDLSAVAPLLCGDRETSSKRARRDTTAWFSLAESSVTAAFRSRLSSSNRCMTSAIVRGQGCCLEASALAAAEAGKSAGGSTKTRKALASLSSWRTPSGERWPLTSISRLPTHMALAGFAEFQACTSPMSTFTTSRVLSSSCKPNGSPFVFFRWTQ